jgi:predicted nuclease of predicted toxin-antitoxin system
VRFKLDENLSPSLAELFAAAVHETHSVAQQGLGGQADARVIEVCGREQRAFVTLDLDLSKFSATRLLNSRELSCSDSPTKRMLRWKRQFADCWIY